MVDVSVCISVHNTATLLPRCLDSVCSQSLQNLEIVLVNNGSTDNSEEIMRYYAEKHPERKFVIVSQEDRSLAGGRQTGINHASGRFLTFLDADDFVDSFAYEKMLRCAEQNQADIVEIETYRDGKVLSSPYTGLHKTHDILKNYFCNGSSKTLMLWLRMYKRDLFKYNVLPTIYTNNEDNFAVPCLLHVANTIYYLKEPLHTYSTDNEGGVMYLYRTNTEYSEKYFNSRIKIVSAINHFSEFVGPEGMKEYIETFNIFKALSFRAFIFEDFYGKSKREKENAIMDLMGYCSRRDLHKYIRHYLPYRKSIDKIIKLFGFDTAYLLSRTKLYLKKIIKI